MSHIVNLGNKNKLVKDKTQAANYSSNIKVLP